MYKNRNKWVVRVTSDNKSRHYGTFDDKVSAAKMYNVIAKKIFGEFSNLNKI